MDMKRLMERWQKLLQNDEKLNRRQFIRESGKWALASLGVTLGGYVLNASYIAADAPLSDAYPFTLGVASGDPMSDSVILWTRLAPDPLHGGGMLQEMVPVTWEIAWDEQFLHLLQRGTAPARPELGHSVHVEVKGLEPNQEYFYRFRTGKDVSPVGRTKTLPMEASSIAELQFAFVSCQNYEDGYFTAYQHLIHERLDFVLHLGDYIYEDAPKFGSVRRHQGRKLSTLEDYRNRYAQYRMDPNLQAAHAAFPWFTIMDDHEVENNWAAEIPQKGQPIGPFLERRKAAFQAFYEHMPLRIASKPTDQGIQLYRRFQYGNLASFHLLDTRQYRDDQASGDGWKAPTEFSNRLGRTLLGAEQEAWLMDGLKESKAIWNVLAQQVFFSRRDRDESEAESVSMDAWDGYAGARDRLLRFIDQNRILNFMVLTGDVHSNWVTEIKSDFRDANSRALGVEWVGTSVSSAGDGFDEPDAVAMRVLEENPHIHFFNGNRGYTICRVTPNRWRTDFRVVPYVSRQGAPLFTRAAFAVNSGEMKVIKMYDSILRTRHA